jgi:phage terminase large subunit-like protein
MLQKGGSKSVMASGIAIAFTKYCHLRGINHRGLVCVMASSVSTAGIIWGHCLEAVLGDSELRSEFKSNLQSRTLKHQPTGIEIVILAPSLEQATGRRPFLVIWDESHEASKLREYSAACHQLRAGAANAGQDSRILTISTMAVEEPVGEFKRLLNMARQVRDGKLNLDFFPAIFEMPGQDVRPDIDPLDSKYWYFGAPSLRYSPSDKGTMDAAEIQKEIDLAVATSDSRQLSMTLSQRLGISSSMTSGNDNWIVSTNWTKLPKVGMQPDRGLRAVSIGVDVGGVDDLAGLVVVGWDANDNLVVHSRQFCVQSAIERAHPNTRTVYQEGIDAGELIVANTTSQMESKLFTYVKSIEAMFGSDVWAGGDLYGLAGFSARFTGTCGMKFRPIKQSFNLLAAKNRLESLVADGCVHHEHGPLLHWNIKNIRFDESTSGIKIRKADAGLSGQGQSKIDAVMALFNAIELIEHPDRVAFDATTMIF